MASPAAPACAAAAVSAVFSAVVESSQGTVGRTTAFLAYGGSGDNHRWELRSEYF